MLRQCRHDWPTASSHTSDGTPLRVAGVSLMEDHAEMTRRARRRRINPVVTYRCVCVMTLISGGCSRTPSVGGDQGTAPGDAVKIDEVQVTTTDTGLIVQYRTRMSAVDCKAQAGELTS